MSSESRVNIGDCTLISVDDHVVEPPDLFEGRLPKKYQDKAPRFITREDGSNVWVYEGHEVETWASQAVAGSPQEEWNFEPASLAEMRPGCYDVHARIKDMSANGEWASLNFPSFVQFPGTLFAVFAHRDPQQAVEMIRAYNDWHLEAWCGEYPDRLIPCGLTPVHDPKAMTKEVRRLADLGCHSVSFMGEPSPFPSFWTDHWDPFWAVCQEVGTVVCMHLGAGASVHHLVGQIEDAPTFASDEERPGDGYGSLTGIPGMPQGYAATLINSHLFERFPRLKVALSEGGIGWIPYMLENADVKYRHHGKSKGIDYGGRLPSEIFNEHVFGCFIEDRAGILARELLNIDMIGWESDYPHSDGVWPHGPEALETVVHGLSDDEVRKITHQNAAEFWQFDPWINKSPDECTVKRLRAEVADWDISVQSRHKRRTSQTRAAMALAGKA